MGSALWGSFVSKVLREVKFKYDHPLIRQELLEHMEESYAALVEEGMDSGAAEFMAVEYMGDAREIGQALNREHNPLLGWLWLAGRNAAAVLLLVVLFYAVVLYGGASASISKGYTEKNDSPLLYEMEIGEKAKVYEERIYLDEMRYYADGTLELRGRSLQWGRNGIRSNTAFQNMRLRDERGQVYFPRESILGKGIFFRAQVFFEDVPAELEKLTLCYDWYQEKELEILLPAEGSGGHEKTGENHQR